MSLLSINENKNAISYIEQAIKSYELAIGEIKLKNNNSKTNKIISLINKNIDDLQNLKNKISDMNYQINNELSKLKQNQKEDKKKIN